MPESGFARKLIDRSGENLSQHPVPDGGDCLGFLAEVAVGGERLAGVGFGRLAPGHRDQGVGLTETLRDVVGTGPARLVAGMNEEEGRLERSEIEAGHGYAAAVAPA